MTAKNIQRRMLKKQIEEFADKHKASQIISQKALELEDYKKAKSIFIYINTDDEVSTDKIIEDAFISGKRVFVPVTSDIMRLVEIFPNTHYKRGKYNIKEPVDFIEANIQPDIAFIPLVGFDKNKNRMGRGKGYYDRYLENYKGKKIALAFAVQQTDAILTEKCDIAMDMVITEEAIF